MERRCCASPRSPRFRTPNTRKPRRGGRIFPGLAREFFRPPRGSIIAGPGSVGSPANNAASPTAKSSPALAGLAGIVCRFFVIRTDLCRLTGKRQQAATIFQPHPAGKRRLLWPILSRRLRKEAACDVARTCSRVPRPSRPRTDTTWRSRGLDVRATCTA